LTTPAPIADLLEALRRQKMRALATDDLLEEHARAPFGPHGPRLHQLATYFRLHPAAGKYALVHTPDGKGFAIRRLAGARHTVPGSPVTDDIFATRAEAEHAVFRLRLRDLQNGGAGG
jgi:hypothetical protein